MAKQIDLSKVKWTSARGGIVQFHKKGESVTGIYVGFTPNKYEGRTTYLLNFRGEDGNTFSIWASTVLDPIRELPKNTPVRITFLGEAGRGKRRYKNFNIEVPEGINLPRKERKK